MIAIVYGTYIEFLLSKEEMLMTDHQERAWYFKLSFHR